jgi:adenine-specific DNA methylase
MIKNELITMAQAKSEAIGKKIVVVECNTIAEAKKCHILFVPANHSNKVEELMEHLKAESILLVTENEGLAQKGSCINFVTKDGKMRFELNRKAMFKARLRVASELVRLAVVV